MGNSEFVGPWERAGEVATLSLPGEKGSGLAAIRGAIKGAADDASDEELPDCSDHGHGRAIGL